MTRAAKALEQSLHERISAEGALSVASFMDHVLAHPQHGYYMRQDPFGVEGDFTTAPEISQIFGEMIALCLIDIWDKIGRPSAFTLLECGPGRGTLMADILRTARTVPEFIAAAHPCLLEVSPALQAIQKQRLASTAGHVPIWVSDLQSVPTDKPVLAVGNELLDALPIHQLRKTAIGWEERMLTHENSALSWMYSPAPQALQSEAETCVPLAKPGDEVEISPARRNFIQQLIELMAAQGGVGLFIDYGTGQFTAGQSLQALYQHQACDVLDHIGQADLSSHVDFGRLKALIEASPANRFCALTSQGAFLQALGGALRLEHLVNAAQSLPQKQDMLSAYHRLTHKAHMGDLFKVLGFVQGYDHELTGF